MQTDHSYHLKKQSDLFYSFALKKKSSSVIKGAMFKLGSPKKIEPNDSAEKHLEKSRVTMIEKNGQVKGLLFECTCGEVVEVFLDFADKEEDE
mgnify:CR=1 FL=1